MLEFFREFRIAQESFMRSLAQVCEAAKTNYNNDPRNSTKIDRCRVNVDVWGPKEGKIHIGIQIWIEGGWPTMYGEEVATISETFESFIGKKLFRQKGFDFSCYVQNVHIRSEDD